MLQQLTTCIIQVFPSTQVIYLFGSFETPHQQPSSDIDVAILLPHPLAKTVSASDLLTLNINLARLAKRNVDLINLRQVPTVLQWQVIAADRPIFIHPDGGEYAKQQFEMLTLSYYQQLTSERADIVADIISSGRVLAT